jgi:hypothetical protein
VNQREDRAGAIIRRRSAQRPHALTPDPCDDDPVFLIEDLSGLVASL